MNHAGIHWPANAGGEHPDVATILSMPGIGRGCTVVCADSARSDVLPVATTGHVPDRISVHSEFDSEIHNTLSGLPIARSDGEDIVVGEFRLAVLLASPERFGVRASAVPVTTGGFGRVNLLDLPPLRCHVNRIGRVRPQPEVPSSLIADATDVIGPDVIISDARTDIASVTDHFAEDRRPSAGESPCEFMGPNDVTAQADLAVSRLPVIQASSPEPAPRGAIDLRPKSGDLSGRIIRLHRVSPSLGVTSPAVTSSAGTLLCGGRGRRTNVSAPRSACNAYGYAPKGPLSDRPVLPRPPGVFYHA